MRNIAFYLLFVKRNKRGHKKIWNHGYMGFYVSVHIYLENHAIKLYTRQVGKFIETHIKWLI